MYIPNYNLFSSHNATGMYVFKADRLAMCNQLMFSSLRKPASPLPSFPQLLTVLCVGLRLCGFFSTQFDIILGVVHVQLTFRELIW